MEGRCAYGVAVVVHLCKALESYIGLADGAGKVCAPTAALAFLRPCSLYVER